MIQKWGKEGDSPALCLKTRAAIWGSRGGLIFILVLGFIVTGSHFASSQIYSEASAKSTWVRGIFPPPPPPPPAPPNDNFSNAIELAGFEVSITGTNFNATVEPGEPLHRGIAANNSVWYTWVAPESGPVEITAGSFLTAVYTGDTISNLVALQMTREPWSAVDVERFQAQAGQKYNISVDDRFDGSVVWCCGGIFELELTLEGIALVQPQATNLPSAQPAAMEFAPLNTNYPIVWLETFADTNSLGILTNPPFQISYTPSAATNVFFSAVGTNSLGQRVVCFPVRIAFTPTNDDFSQAFTITDASPQGVFSRTTDTATAEPGEPDLGQGIAAVHTVWWKWTPTYLVPTVVTLQSPSSAMAILKGTDFSNLQRIATLHNGGSFPWSPGPANTSFVPEPGVTYYFVGQSDSYVQWRYDQQTLQLTPATPQHIYIGEPIEFDAAWYESNDPPVTVNFVIGGYYDGGLFGSGYYPIALAGVASSEPYKTIWTPTNGGKFFAWALCTNNLGMLRESAVTELNIYASNDDFDRATLIPPDTTITSFTFCPRWTSTEIDEPPHRHEPAVGTWWWQWTPSYSGSVRLKATRGTYAVSLEIFSGSSLTDLHRIADNSGKDHRMGIIGSVCVPVRAGQTYCIRVDDTRPNFHIPFVPDTNITLSLEPASLGPRAELELGFYRSFAHSRLPMARVFMPDGQIPVIGNNFHAQLYVGPTATSLSPIGGITGFMDSSYPPSQAGAPWPIPVILPAIKAHTRVFAQVRVWDSYAGATYEATQAAGGLIGESKVLRVITGSEDAGPAPLTGITNFKLHGPN